jgi:hypothetical protein
MVPHGIMDAALLTRLNWNLIYIGQTKERKKNKYIKAFNSKNKNSAPQSCLYFIIKYQLFLKIKPSCQKCNLIMVILFNGTENLDQHYLAEQKEGRLPF